ncbi:MAG: hypothetical protein RL354_1133, partial [Planctomycetota bacterium]
MRRKKLLIALTSLLAILVLAVVLAPTLLSGYARGRIEREIASRVLGTVSVRAVELGWFSPQRLSGLAIDGGAEVGTGRRYPFGLPRTDNANYLWIQDFYSALNDTGRAGFVMANSASDARASEQDIRQKLIESRAVDVMVAVGPNMFYTVTLPCTLWFFD